jgi:hypothetical protein
MDRRDFEDRFRLMRMMLTVNPRCTGAAEFMQQRERPV